MAAIDLDDQIALMYPQPDAAGNLTLDQIERIRSCGQTLTDLRESRNLTRQDLAARMRTIVGYPVPLSAFTTWEQGHGLPPRPLLPVLEQALGLKDGEFLRRAAAWHRGRQKHLDAAEKAKAETEIALREDGRPPRTRRRPSKKRT